MRTVIGAMLIGAGISAPALAVEDYDACIALIASDPTEAERQAGDWARFGGGAAARHCYALALIETGAESRAVDEMLGIVAEEAGLDDPTRAEILVQAGELLIERDEPLTARLVAEQAVGLGGGQADALSLRAAAKLASDDPEGALADLNRAVSQGSTHHRVLVRRSVAHRAVGRFIEARDDAVYATELAPDAPSAWLERGRVEARLRDKISARLSLLKAIELDEQGEITSVAQNVLQRMEAGID